MGPEALAIAAALQTREAARENRHRYDAFASGGSLYNYYRDYDPAIGRYIQSDPIGLWGGANTYGYVNQAPVGAIDPYGLFDLGEWALGQIGKAKRGAAGNAASTALGKSKGIECAKDCRALTNPRQSRSDAATEICNRLIPERLSRGNAIGGDAFHTCRTTCEELAKECDKKKPC